MKNYVNAAKYTLSDKEQFPKPIWQSVRDDLHRVIMILPSSHSSHNEGGGMRTMPG